jgi:hypothetical protein
MGDDPYRTSFLDPGILARLAEPLVPPMPHIPPNPMAQVANQQLKAAKSMYERVVQQIADFESRLNPDEEVGARFVAAPGEGPIHIENVGYWGPDMLIFHGQNADGRPVQVLQHVTQLSITLTALPTQGPEPRRVGFVLLNGSEK